MATVVEADETKHRSTKKVVSNPKIILQDLHNSIIIPPEVVDLSSFCTWASSEDFPTRGRYSYLNGSIWVDLSMEQPFTHNQVKAEISEILRRLTKETQTGYLFFDRMLLRNEEAQLSTEPDAMFVSFDAIKSGRVKLVEAVGEGYRELSGSPEMVLEVVSDYSEKKDQFELHELYAQAKITEYWLVDAREEPLQFDILKLSAKGYSKTRKASGGWLKSGVFGKSFRLTQSKDPLGNPQFTLEMRD
jgi:Uma2 family endonuclease